MARAGYPAWDEDEAFFDERPARRARRKRRPWLRMILLSSLMIGGLVYFARQKGDEVKVAVRNGVPASVLIAPAPVWSPVAASPALFTVERAGAPLLVEARQHTSGAREDTLTFGRFGDARHARITLIQGSTEPPRSFFVDVVRRAAEAGLAVARNAQSRMISTKFGPMEAAAMTLAGSREQECQTFRLVDQEAAFGIQGWMCGANAAAMTDAQLACFIDGIGLSGTAGPSVKALFVRAERSRTDSCAAGRTGSMDLTSPPRP